MARKVTASKTAEERREEAARLQEVIAEQVEALKNSEAWVRFMQFVGAFHSYSLNNIFLILSQRMTATEVAGFRKWQSLDRQVRKGEKAIKIFGYAEKKISEAEASSDTKRNAKGEPVVPYFPLLSVFDVAQTDPTEAWEDPAISHRLTGADEAGIYGAVVDYLTGLGWTVAREPIAGEVNGFTATDGTRRVVVDAGLSDAQAAKTALHEAAHVLLHADQTVAEYVQHRDMAECEAESVAFIVAGVLGLDTTAYSVGYIAGWTKCDAEILRTTAGNVLRTAHSIIDAITA